MYLPVAFALAALALAPGAVAGEVRAQDTPAAGCAEGDKACVRKALKAHPARKAAFWRETLARPVGERIGPAPPELIDFLRLDNLANGYPEKPAASRLTNDFLADVQGAIADLPPAVRRLLDETFAGVWFVDDLGGTGYTDLFVDEADRPLGGFVVLDAAVLRKFTANAWASWKESTPFRPQQGWKLEARIERAGEDDRRGAIRYILLHELGHVLSIARDLHPRWDREPKDVPQGARFPFFALSWTVDRKANRYASPFDGQFSMRRSVVYYLGAKLDAAVMPRVYARLEKTNFPTLYAATSPGDDFAESFASYVHVVLLERPWEITIRRDGRVVHTTRTCWKEARCAAKRRLLERLLE
ncbi:MAG: hypothetical protein IPH30_10630 [Betaproteobacteria bacterium]|nr:hypothetical protein [Betaproteobacteria bacterium]